MSQQTTEEEGAAEGCLLPPEPQKPLDSDCCGTGCTPCVFDIYEQEMVLWKKKCEEILYGNDEAQSDEKGVLGRWEYTKFTVAEVKPEACDIVRYRFTIPDNQRLPVGLCQHLILRWQNSGSVVTRQYTPVSAPNCRGHFEVVIKIYDDGQMSDYIKTWCVGSLVEWRGPFGDFTYQHNSYKHILLLAAGTGVAPMIQLIRHILECEADETRMQLLYACKSYNAIMFKPELYEWRSFWNFSVCYFLNQAVAEAGHKMLYNENIVYEHINKDHIASHLHNKTSCLVLLCGTKSFEKDMINYLQNLGVEFFKF